ncbi:MAG: AzlC family ABC transporter permease, partial [Chloroflexi bacterium]|nr:AzlC family ABC transporter permease [Chloroflexota bacterium]
MPKTDRNTEGRHRYPILQGMEMALPVVLGYLTVGFAYGMLARNAGLSLLESGLMSLIVYAGSAQLISVGLFAAGVPPLSIILTTFIV